MFSRPSYGWTSVSIGGKIFGQASYLTDPITDTIYELAMFVSGSSQTCHIEYDGEGYEFGIVEINGTLYVFVERASLKLYPIRTHDKDKRPQAIAAKLLKKALRNLEDYKHAWIHWHMDSDSDALALRESELDVLGDLGREALKRLR